ncbi:MAG: ROK family glucokinase [Lachnospiraceae bacterium]|nr:ROK family glucokinase [Lachnospiraceae bacterium]MBP5276464.1 ROK family glucokinase [Lachnospiraceae bacterium]MBQ4275541.1 ROK family glucokinase [Lachnospiraceae bacterium]
MKYIFAVDLGGTTVKMGLFNESGEVLEKWEIVTVKDNNGAQILPDIAESIKKKAAEKNLSNEDVLGVGIGVPGPIDSKGNIFGAPNLGWGNFNVSDTLSSLTGYKVKTGNDANVAALGEMWMGGGKGYNSIVMVTLGTGVGGGVIVDGKIVAGAKGAGGEIGHILIDETETETCGCGKKGCLEQYGSATGVVRLANRRLAKDDKASILRGKEVDCKAVWDAVKEGDEVAIEIADEFGKILGKGLGMIACVVNPEAFVIGGGVSKAGNIILDYIVDNFKNTTFRGCKETDFRLATLGNDAGIYGAAKLVIE